MADFDLVHVKINGIGDQGKIHATVILGFWSEEIQDRHLLEVPTVLDASLDKTLRELREEAKSEAISLLRTSLDLLEGHTVDELHEMATKKFAEGNDEISRRALDNLDASLANIEHR